MVKSYNPKHHCQVVRINKKASSTWICRGLGNELRDDPNMKLFSMRKKLNDKFGLTRIPKANLFRARMKARGASVDAHTKEFFHLRCYANMVLSTNPDNVAIHSDATNNPPNLK